MSLEPIAEVNSLVVMHWLSRYRTPYPCEEFETGAQSIFCAKCLWAWNAHDRDEHDG